jgi:ABC-type lipoprotein release transport system permease subunit
MRVLKSIAGVIVGFFAASVIMTIVETINGRVLHPALAKSAEGVTDREVLRGIMAAAPVSAFLVVLAGWILGSLVGGWLAARIAGRAGVAHGLVLGALLTMAGCANNLMIPPPLWFWVVSVLVFFPAAYAGARAAARG